MDKSTESVKIFRFTYDGVAGAYDLPFLEFSGELHELINKDDARRQKLRRKFNS